MKSSIYDFTMKDIDGNNVELGKYKNKVLMIVNVASKCGLTPQYEELQELYEKYKDKGLTVLGFPANNFMGQEPGTDEEIKTFCTLNYNVNFPMFSKISVKGKDKHDLYKYLTDQDNPDYKGEISWNFEKILIDQNGQVIRRFNPKVKPLDADVVNAIELAINK